MEHHFQLNSDVKNKRSRSNNELSIKDKVRLIEESANKSVRQLAKDFGVAIGTVSRIVKRKQEYLSCYAQNPLLESRRRLRTTGNEDINNSVLEWFKQACGQNLPISGPILQHKALGFAQQYGISNFKASNGWLESFCQRNSISFKLLNGKSLSLLPPSTYTPTSPILPREYQWKQQPEQQSEQQPVNNAWSYLLKDYNISEIFTCGLTRLFYQNLPDSPFLEKRKNVDLLTILLCVSATGQKLKPLVMGRAKLKNTATTTITTNTATTVNTNTTTAMMMLMMMEYALPVVWKASEEGSNKNEFFLQWLRQMNEEMRLLGKRIVLLIDSSLISSPSASPSTSPSTLSNIKLVTIPSNTTPPFDQGIITTFKLHYTKYLMLIALESPQQQLQKLDLLTVLCLISRAWESVDQAYVRECFNQAEFISSSSSATTTTNNNNNNNTMENLTLIINKLGKCLGINQASDYLNTSCSLWGSTDDLVEISTSEDTPKDTPGGDTTTHRDTINKYQLMTGEILCYVMTDFPELASQYKQFLGNLEDCLITAKLDKQF